MDSEEAIKIAGCVQALPQEFHGPICSGLTGSKLGYVFEADGLGEVTVRMTKSACLAVLRLQSAITRVEAG